MRRVLHVRAEITVKDGEGRTVFSSGGIGEDGALVPETCVFQTVFGDPEGKPTVNVTEAAMILTDRRIQPKGWEDETFYFGKELKKPLKVNVALKYRSMDPALVKLLIKDGDYEVPVVVMTELEEIIK